MTDGAVYRKDATCSWGLAVPVRSEPSSRYSSFDVKLSSYKHSQQGAVARERTPFTGGREGYAGGVHTSASVVFKNNASPFLALDEGPRTLRLRVQSKCLPFFALKNAQLSHPTCQDVEKSCCKLPAASCPETPKPLIEGISLHV